MVYWRLVMQFKILGSVLERIHVHDLIHGIMTSDGATMIPSAADAQLIDSDPARNLECIHDVYKIWRRIVFSFVVGDVLVVFKINLIRTSIGTTHRQTDVIGTTHRQTDVIGTTHRQTDVGLHNCMYTVY